MNIGEWVVGLVLLWPLAAKGDDWASWRGPFQNGISREQGLVSDWSLSPKKNVLWTSEIGGRATPIILNDRVYLNCRTLQDVANPKEKIHAREQVVCWDAKTGKEIWRDEFNVFYTDIPSSRIGWASMSGDPETGNVYVHSVSGRFRCYSGDGKVLWERSLVEEFGQISGYGGRIQTPIIDEDRVIVSFLAANWGATKGPGPMHFYYCFDKRTGEVQWVTAPGEAPEGTNCSVPVVAVVNGQRMLIGGNGDGNLYAMNARTGQKIWGFAMSKAALNTSPVVDGNRVFIAHGADNIDNGEFGRVQCIDATGTGDVTATKSVWRVDGIKAGFTGLLVKDGMLFVVTDTGNLFAFDTASGKELWTHNLGTVGKSAPVWADGKLFVTEVNGRVHILKPSRAGCESLSVVHLKAANGDGDDEIYASPAISNGRIVIVTRDRTICIGDSAAKITNAEIPALPAEAAPESEMAFVQLRPYEVVVSPGQSQKFELHCFDKHGHFIKKVDPTLTAAPELAGLEIDGASVSAPQIEKDIAGTVAAKIGELSATARVRVFNSSKVWAWDFEQLTGVATPPTWIRAFAKLKPLKIENNTVMTIAGPSDKTKGRPSHAVSLGSPSMKNYTIQADVLIKGKGRQLANIGISANRYSLMIKGGQSKLQVYSWPPHLHNAKEVPFKAESNVWYTMKFKVDVRDGQAFIFGKAWKTSEKEPDAWTLEHVDPHPNETGSPGLCFYALTDCMYDNVKVTFE